MFLCGNISKTFSLPNRKWQGADILRSFSSSTLHLSHVMCHWACVIFEMSLVTFFLSFLLEKIVKLGNVGSVSNRATPSSLLSLHYFLFSSNLSKINSEQRVYLIPSEASWTLPVASGHFLMLHYTSYCFLLSVDCSWLPLYCFEYKISATSN